MFSNSDVLTTGIQAATIGKCSELYLGGISGALLRKD